MKRIVVFTGAGVSAESGIKTFRDSGGLWEEHRIEDVATPEAWRRNPGLVLEFYNQRRKQVLSAMPNAAHLALKQLEEKFEVQIITQNIDDLHERAGSSKVLHLHGEIRKARSSIDPGLVYDIEGESLLTGDCCALGSQLRPHIVWFGESVPAMEEAILMTSEADVFIAIGTSLEVYPAASLLLYAPEQAMKVLIDPRASRDKAGKEFTIIAKTAGEGVPELVHKLLNNYV
ncbi:MAG: NAD-dependent deacylase [Bacteroidia bacterium]|nr:NAD-dependent deacylase [Bacteroidia bacterium]